jgi:protein TonB
VVINATGQPALLPPGTPRQLRIGGNVGPLRLINHVRPVYPPSAKNAGVEGVVKLQSIIGTDGSVQAVRVLSSIDADLTNAAVEAYRQWKYAPALLNGIPVETTANVDTEFSLTR